MTGDRPDAEPSQPAGLPYWRRALIVIVVALTAGPLGGALVLALFGPVMDLFAGRMPHWASIVRDFRGGLDMGMRLGLPFAAAAALPVAFLVARRGRIGYGLTAAITFGAICIVAFPVLGGIAILAPFIAAGAVLVALALQGVTVCMARRLFGVEI